MDRKPPSDKSRRTKEDRWRRDKGLKLCHQCGIELPRSAFDGETYRHSGKERFRLYQKCRDCYSSLKEAAESGGEVDGKRVEAKAYRSRGDEPSFQPKPTRVYRIWASAKNRAKTKGMDFNLSVSWIQERFDKGLCEATGEPLNSPRYPRERTEGQVVHDMDAVLDRIDSTKGYTEDNSRIVSHVFNTMKNKWSDERFAELALKTSAGRKLLLAEVLEILEAVLGKAWERR